jgi:hypothetical protein
MDEDRYLDLEELARYSTLSVRTLRRHIASQEHPLPALRVHGSKGRGRIIVSRRAFDEWAQAFRFVGNPMDTRTWVRKLAGR